MNYIQKRDTRKWLNRYRFIQKEIQAREKHLEDFIKDIYNPLQAVSIDGMPKGQGGVSDQTHTTYCRIENTYKKIMGDMQNRIENLEMALKEIEYAINSLDEYERCICFHRFMLGIHWADLPAYIGYEERNCRNIEEKALKIIYKSVPTIANKAMV